MSEDNSTNSVQSTPLPSALKGLRTRRYLAGGAVILVAAAAAVSTGEWECLLAGIFSLWFLWGGLSLERDYRRGVVQEAEMICSGIRTRHTGSSLIITFRSADDSTGTIQMRYAGGKNRINDFTEGCSYLVYYESGNPANLLAYTPV